MDDVAKVSTSTYDLDSATHFVHSFYSIPLDVLKGAIWEQLRGDPPLEPLELVRTMHALLLTDGGPPTLHASLLREVP